MLPFFKKFFRNKRPGRVFKPLATLEHPKSGYFSLQTEHGVQDFYLHIRPGMDILFVSAWENESMDVAWLDCLPGSCLYIRMNSPEAVRNTARHLADNLGIPASRVIYFATGGMAYFMAASASAHSGAWLCCHKPHLEKNFAEGFPLCYPEATKPSLFLAKTTDAGMEYLIAQADARGYLLTGRIGRQSPLSASSLVLKTLQQAGINFAAKNIEPIRSSQIYLLRGNKASRMDAAIFLPSAKGHLQEIVIKPQFDWDANPFNDNNWMAQLQMWRPLDAFILNFEKSGDAGWLDLPVRLIIDWHNYYGGKSTTGYVWADMMAGLRAMKLAWFLSLHYCGKYRLRGNELRIFKDLATRHADFIMNNISWNNHAFMDLHGLMSLAQVLPPDSAMRAMDFAKNSLLRLMRRQFDQNGVHQENSPQYQHFALSCLQMLDQSGWFDMPKLRECARKAKDVLNWMRMPDGRLFAIGDTDNTQECAKYEKPSGNIFNCSDYVIMSEGQAGLFFMCARHTRWHKHSDDLSLMWHDAQDILCDPGKYAYQETPERQYARATRAHNTLEINDRDEYSRGRPRRPRKPLTMVEMARKENGLYLASAIMYIQEFDVRHRRRLVFSPGRFLVILDDVYSLRVQDYKLHWHFHPDINVSGSHISWLASLVGGMQAHICLHSDADIVCRMAKGEKQPRMLGFFSPGYKKIVPACCLEIAATVQCWNVATAFSLNAENSLRRIEKNKYLFRHGQEEFVFHMNADKFDGWKIGG